MFRLQMMGLAGSWMLAVVAGCNTDPLWVSKKDRMGPISQAGPMVEGERLGMTPTEREEDRIEDVVLDRARYHQGLIALRDYYSRTGNDNKYRWACQEIASLSEIAPYEEAEVQLAAAEQEVDLVELVIVARRQYRQSLKALHDFYQGMGDPVKIQWVEQEIAAARDIQEFLYLFEAEVAGEWLRPSESIPDADALYARAVARMKEGGHGIPVFYREDIMLDALAMFQRLIRVYPTSDKIDEAAFYLGEIHKEYLKDQEDIAVRWYERAWTWNPDIELPARFQAAVITDYRMHDRARALELYHAVLAHEAFDASNVRLARQRIQQLSKEMAASTG
jgi:hypothetical protein